MRIRLIADAEPGDVIDRNAKEALTFARGEKILFCFNDTIIEIDGALDTIPSIVKRWFEKRKV